eukprot:38675-Pleurochrysis_carterae.AAC.1
MAMCTFYARVSAQISIQAFLYTTPHICCLVRKDTEARAQRTRKDTRPREPVVMRRGVGVIPPVHTTGQDNETE